MSATTSHPSPAAPPPLTLLSALSPPSQTRAWLSTPHPHLPLLATCSTDKSVRIYSLATFRLHSTIEGGHKRSVRACAWKPGSVNGESVLATGSFDASAGIWRRWEQDLVSRSDGYDDDEQQDGDGDDAGDTMMKDGGGGRRVVGIGEDGMDGGDEEEEEEEWRFAVVLDGHESEIKSVAWSAGGNFLATCSRDKSVWVWEEMEDDNFETIAVLQEHEADVKCVVWHPEEELLASSSYDDSIRLYREDIDDWTCISLLNGHTSTVWSICFEPMSSPHLSTGPDRQPLTPAQQSHLSFLHRCGPRLISCSADQTIRIWRRVPKEQDPHQSSSSSSSLMTTSTGKPIPSSIRPANAQSIEEEWIEEATLPQRHERVVLSVAWSPWSGRVVSTGGDGKVVVYQENWVDETSTSTANTSTSTTPTNTINEDPPPPTPTPTDNEPPQTSTSPAKTTWTVLAEQHAAHGVFEINHVCWARRFDGKHRQRRRRRRHRPQTTIIEGGGGSGENVAEMVISTGDDGVVRTWIVGGDDGGNRGGEDGEEGRGAEI
ncbi:MAG: Cytosolic iron-sulfur protein assembly protein [Sclerophora amabilis]|nr:MAG: Cytosolic iron-sulfur protein assembly protein [Sclerophora amabilis]